MKGDKIFSSFKFLLKSSMSSTSHYAIWSEGSRDKAGIWDFDRDLGGLCSGEHMTKVAMHKELMHMKSGRKWDKDMLMLD